MEYAKVSFTDLQTNGFFKNYKARVYTKSNGVKWVHINASIIYDKDKNPIAAQGIVRDITKERTSNKKLKESENRLSTLVLNLNSGIILEDENRKIVLTNTKFCELLNGNTHPDDLLGLDITLVSEQNKNLVKNPELFVKRLHEIVEKKLAFFGAQIEMINGKVMEINYMPIILDSKSKGFLWTFTDITLEKKYNVSLEVQKLKFSNIIANMNLGLVEVNNDDEILLINQSFLDMSGYSEKELLGKKSKHILFKEKGDDLILQQNKHRLIADSYSYELKVKNKNGEFKHWLVSGAPNYNLLGDVVGSIGIHLDITALKSLELQKELILRKLEISNNQLHEYAHVVSHDLKSPLRSIDALVSWIKADNKGKFDQITEQNFQLLETTLETMEKLISNVLKYSSAGSTAKESEEKIDLNSILSNLKNMLLIPDNISINILNKFPIVRGDKTKFQQLFQNLLSNAIKFSDKENGVIEISYVDNHTFHQFSIKDNGIGIKKKYHDKIFQIFHSLNKRKDSTGVGLSIVKKIIQLHEGDIWLESEPNIGTTFYFTIKKVK
jgi:PAS domain S-box-containing protein